ncbi:MAG: alpha/beta hydrolase [Actinobacteria bacterium]|nr:alpha/beta hydrolase [Actinomycetota bacterium]
MGHAFLIESIVALALTVNAIQPLPGTPLSPALFFLSWLTSELAPHNFVIQVGISVAFIAGGALDEPSGRIALLLSGITLAGLGLLMWEAQRARGVVERALREGLGPDYQSEIPPDRSVNYDLRVPWRQLLLPFRQVHPDVEKLRNLQYGPHGRRNRLDVYRHKDHPADAPVLIQIHGSGWTVSNKDQQGKPIMLHLASRGWVCIAPNYRLSPRATWPDHLVDAKRVVAWAREHIAEYGGDPSFIAVTGGSAGGHLASMLALTADDPQYQPDFADADTSIQACVPIYAPADLFDRRHPMLWGQIKFLLEPIVMKQRLRKNPEVFRSASPTHRVREDAPPFFVIGAAHDLLVPKGVIRRFVARLREASAAPVCHAELPGAQHAFDVFPSIRTAHVVRGVERFLDVILVRRGEEVPGRGDSTPAARSGKARTLSR